ncbi:hypothetical protein J437_LFUL007260 [Ladona fulva]|uniref:Uncharacterized protein n=1 Tax=Ladona fulva TaxID=123851 RepID=A0A8K0JXQ1_LADFU|nr:hypothetical protein J437_LFUL007260 [Ladona fulva]
MAEYQDNMALSPGQIFNDQRVLRIPRSDLKVATWNVRSLFIAGKLDNVDIEMKRLKIVILGIRDVQWPGVGKCNTENGVIYYSGSNNSTHRYAVAIMISKNINKAVTNRFRNAILSAKTYSGADIGSDHNPVVASARIKLKKMRKPKQKQLDLSKVKTEKNKKIMAEEINKNFKHIKNQNLNTSNINEKWENIKQAIISGSKDNLNHG